MVDVYERDALRRNSTPDSEQARSDEVENNTGGFVFSISDLARVKRFLILGSDAGTYYQRAKELTRQNAEVIQKMADSDNDEVALGLVSLIVDVSERGLAPKVNPALFALAIAANGANVVARQAAKNAVPIVVRTGSHLLTYVRYVDSIQGWSRAKRNGVNTFYQNRDANQLAYQFLKYFQREGWDQRDILRTTHPKLTDPAVKDLFDWVTKKNLGDHLPKLVYDFLEVQTYSEQTPNHVVLVEKVIAESNLSWEMLPDWCHRNADIWRALLANNRVPMTALLRNLARLTELGVIDLYAASPSAQLILEKLTNAEEILKARIHPVNVLKAVVTYARGSMRSGRTYTPQGKIVDALNQMFYLSFGTVNPAGKRTLIGLDISASMTWEYDPDGILTAQEISAAMALVIAATEPWTASFGFSTSFMPLSITGKERLDDLLQKISRLPHGGTDCSLPMREALRNNWEVDTFVIITDNETNSAPMHVWQALGAYRRSAPSRANAKLVVMSVTATNFSIADPKDPLGQLDICGFGSDVPQLVTAFSGGF